MEHCLGSYLIHITIFAAANFFIDLPFKGVLFSDSGTLLCQTITLLLITRFEKFVHLQSPQDIPYLSISYSFKNVPLEMGNTCKLKILPLIDRDRQNNLFLGRHLKKKGSA